MAEVGLEIAVVGATGSVGTDLVEAFELSPIPVARWLFVASATRVHQPIEAGGKRVKVLASSDDGLPEAVLEEADLVIFATPAEVTRKLAPAVVEAGIAIIEVGGSLLDQGVLAVPLAGVAVDPETYSDRRVVCSPSAPGVIAAAVLRPLTALGLQRAQLTTLLPAGVAGRSGAEELSRQVVALFNSSDPPRSVFPDGLAFDLIGSLGAPTDDWTGAERRLSLELAALLRLPPPHLPATLIMVPTFTGVAMSIVARLGAGIGADQVRGALEALPTVSVADPPTSPLSSVGRTTVNVGRIRDDPAGEGVHMWVTADNLRFGASANVLAIASQLWRQNLL